MGSRREPFQAGYQPNTMPMTAATDTDSTMAETETETGQPICTLTI